MMASFFHFTTANDSGAVPAHAILNRVIVGTGAASAIVTIYNGTTTSDPVVAVMNAAAAISHDFGNLRLGKGLFAKLTGGNADVTVIYS